MQFLYPSEADTHRLLRFLLDKLSKSSSRRPRGNRKGRLSQGRSRNSEDEIGGSAITATVRQRLSLWQEEWKQSSSIDKETVKEKAERLRNEWTGSLVKTAEPTSKDELSALFSELLTAQEKSRALLVPRVLELNARNALKAALFNDLQFSHSNEETEDVLKDLGVGVQVVAASNRRGGFESSFLRAVKFADERDWNLPTRSHDVDSTVANGAEFGTSKSKRTHAAAGTAVSHEDGNFDSTFLEQEASSLSREADKVNHRQTLSPIVSKYFNRGFGSTFPLW